MKWNDAINLTAFVLGVIASMIAIDHHWVTLWQVIGIGLVLWGIEVLAVFLVRKVRRKVQAP